MGALQINTAEGRREAVLSRLRASASHYVRTTKFSQIDRAALRLLIEEGLVEIVVVAGLRVYQEVKK